MRGGKWLAIRTGMKRAGLLLFILALAAPFVAPGKSSAGLPANPDLFKVFYYGNGATGGEAPSLPDYVAVVVVSGPGTLDKAGYRFLNWNSKADGTGRTLDEGDTLRIADNIFALYAQWGPIDDRITPQAVTYDRNAAGAAHADAKTVLTKNDPLTGIANGAASLTPDDYSIAGNTVTIKKAYLDQRPVGTTLLTFKFQSGSTSKLILKVVDTYTAKEIIDAALFSASEVPHPSPQMPYITSQAEVMYFVPYGTDRTHLTPILLQSPFSEIVSPTGAQDFSRGPVTYTVKSTIDGTTKAWKVIVNEEPKAFVSPGGFAESAANDGTIAGAVTVTLANDTFEGAVGTDYVGSGKVVVTNVPAGLTVAATKASDNTMTIRLNGAADAHEAANSVANLHVKFQETPPDGLMNRFWLYSLTNREFDLGVSFANSPTFAVAYDGNGNTGGTVPVDNGAYPANKRATVLGNTGGLTRTGYTFAGWNTARDGKGTSYAAGSTYRMGTANATLYAKWVYDLDILQGALDPIAVPGQSPQTPYATSQAEWFFFVPYGTDRTRLTPILTLSPNAFIESPTGPQDFSHGPVTYKIKSSTDGSTKDWKLIVEEEPKAFVSPGGFAESAANDGTISGAVTVTLANDTFKGAVGTDYTANGKIIVTNVPAGLTAVATKTSAETVTIRLTGSATSHAESDSIANLHVKFRETPPDGLMNRFWLHSLTNREFDLSVGFANAPRFTVVYDGNGSTGGAVPADNGAYAAGERVTVLGNTGSLTRTGYAFAGWNTARDGKGTNYSAGATFDAGSADVTLYARWSAVVANGGGTPEGGAEPGKVVAGDGNLLLPAGREGEVRLGDTVKIDIPSNATDNELKLTINRVLDAQGLLADNEKLLSSVFEVLKNFAGNFKHPVTVTFAFDSTKLKEGQRAAIFYYAEAKKAWVEVGGTVDGDRISAEVDHFTKFAVLAVDAPPANEGKLSDVTGHWAAAGIERAVADGWVRGYPDGTFQPDRTLTRAEFAVMAANALRLTGEPAAAFADDAAIPDWARSGIGRAAKAGLVRGDTKGAFRPADGMTRAETAAVIANALGLASLPTDATGFADDASIPAWARGAVAAAKKLGLLSGKGENVFDPNGFLTRAEAVTVLSSLLAHKKEV